MALFSLGSLSSSIISFPLSSIFFPGRLFSSSFDTSSDVPQQQGPALPPNSGLGTTAIGTDSSGTGSGSSSPSPLLLSFILLIFRWSWKLVVALGGLMMRKEWWNWYLVWVGVLVAAYFTNPNDTSFRHFLRDLSFHQHLRRLHQYHTDPTAIVSSNGKSSGGQNNSDNKLSPSTHALSFSNRISISLRTPPYMRQNYGFFSTVTLVRPGISNSPSTTSSNGSGHPTKQGTEPQQQAPPPPHAKKTAVVESSGGVSRQGGSKKKKKHGSKSGGSVSVLPSAHSVTTHQPIGSRTDLSSNKATVGFQKPPGFPSPHPLPPSDEPTSLLTSLLGLGPKKDGFFIGAFGKWWCWDDGSSEDGTREKDRLKGSVVGMQEIEVAEKPQLQPSPAVVPRSNSKNNNNDEIETGEERNADAARSVDTGGDEGRGDEDDPEADASTSDDPSTSSASSVTAHQQLGENNNSTTAATSSSNAQYLPSPNNVVPCPAPHRSTSRPSSVYAKPAPTVFRAGQRRPSPISPAALKKSAAVGSTSGKSTFNANSNNDKGNYLNTGVDKGLPGLPFHVSRDETNKSDSAGGNTDNRRQSAMSACSTGSFGDDGSSEAGDVRDDPRREADVEAGLGGARSFKSSSQERIPPLSHHHISSKDKDAGVLADLRNQIVGLQNSFASQETKLQSELEDLKRKKKDEDGARSQLKSRVKELEETKREAEVRDREESKKLEGIEKKRKEAAGRLERLQAEIESLKREEKEKLERAEKAKRVKELRARVRVKQEELKAVRQGEEASRVENAQRSKREAEGKRNRHKENRLKDQPWGLEIAADIKGSPDVVKTQSMPVTPIPSSVAAPPPGLRPPVGTKAAEASVSFPVPPVSRLRNRSDAASSSTLPPSILPPHQSTLSAFSSEFRPKSVSGPTLPLDPSQNQNPPSAVQNGLFESSGFLEHRKQHHRRAVSSRSQTLPEPSPFDSGSKSQDPSGLFSPFGPSVPPLNAPSNTQARAGLSLPFQYLSTGLLPMDSPTSEPVSLPMSPVTPHQASLLPSQLFHMLDGDQDQVETPSAPRNERRSVVELGGFEVPSAKPSRGEEFVPIVSSVEPVPPPSVSGSGAGLNPKAKSFSPTSTARSSRSSSLSIPAHRHSWGSQTFAAALPPAPSANRLSGSFRPFDDDQDPLFGPSFSH